MTYFNPLDEDFPYPHLDPEDDPSLKEALNAIDMGLAGSEKPRIIRSKFIGEKNSWWDGDNDARSPLEADLEDIDG